MAVVGVANELYRTGGFSWTTLVVAIGYPMYFVPRKIGRPPSGVLSSFW